MTARRASAFTSQARSHGALELGTYPPAGHRSGQPAKHDPMGMDRSRSARRDHLARKGPVVAEDMTLARRVERYENRPRSDRNAAVEHEQLYHLIDKQIGPVEARFFDEEKMLPYAVRGLPWPMRRHDASSFVLLRLLLTTLVGCCTVILLHPADLMPGIVAGSAVAAAFYLLATHAPRLMPPKDLEHRCRLVSKFRDMQLATMTMADD